MKLSASKFNLGHTDVLQNECLSNRLQLSDRESKDLLH